MDNPVVFSYVKDKFLNHQWSPEQIDGRLKLEKSDIQISYSTIYRGIYARRFDEEVKSYRGRYQKASERLQKAQKALQEAEEQNRLPHRNETTLQVIRRERELVDVRAKAEEARIEFDQVRADRYSVLKKADLIRAELADEVSRAYNADPADIDHATMTLLESGILLCGIPCLCW